jgi:MFS family permease
MSASTGSTRPPETGSTKSLQAVVVSLVLLSTTVLPTFMTASLAVEMRHSFALGDTLLGAAVATPFAVSALVSWFAGGFVDRIGLGSAVRLTAVIGAASSLGIAFGARSAPALLGFLVLTGLANSLSTPAGAAVLGRALSTRRLSVGLGVQHAGAPVGALLAGLALPLVAVPFGWRAAFALHGVLTLLLPFVIRLERGAPTTRAKGRVGRGSIRPLVLFAIATALATGSAGGMVGFLVIYAVDIGIPAGPAGLLLAAASFTAAAGRIASGWLVAGREDRALHWTAAMMAAGAVGYAGVALGHPGTVIAGAIVAGGIGWAWSGLIGLAVMRAHPNAPGAAIGIWSTGTYVGAGGGPLLFGIVADGHSYTAVWVLAVGMVLAAAVIVVAATPLLQRPRDEAAGGAGT